MPCRDDWSDEQSAARRHTAAKEHARNAAREAAMAKLTPEERKLLGVR